MIKAVIFDYGGVVSNGGKRFEIPTRLSKSLGISEEASFELLAEPWVKLFNGSVDENSFWKLIEEKYGSKIPLGKRDIWNSWADMAPRPEVISYIKELKSKNYIVGLLSNTVPHTEELIRNEGIYDLFSPCLLSTKIGSAKPEVEAYQELLKQLPEIRPEEIIFIDDQQRCLIPAKVIGIKTVLGVSGEQIIRDVNTLLEAE